MLLKSLHVEHYRSYNNTTLSLANTLTTITGENSVGKSSIIDAIFKLVSVSLDKTHFSDHPDELDFPYGEPGRLIADLQFELTAEETVHVFTSSWPASGEFAAARSVAEQFFTAKRYLFRLVYDQFGSPVHVMSWGTYTFQGSQLQAQSATSRVTELHKQCLHLLHNAPEHEWNTHLDQVIRGGHIRLPYAPQSVIGGILSSKLKHIREFRNPFNRHSPTALETFTGSETIDVLFNLKVHPDRAENDRYSEIQTEFRRLFPRFSFDVVKAPASDPRLRFVEADNRKAIPTSLLSAGVQQTLALLTNLIGRHDLVIALEHPESFFHPHAMRAISQHIHNATSHNQLIITTHDPHFVNPDNPLSIRRFVWTPGSGTTIKAIDDGLTDKELAQMKTVLRPLHNREIVFARSVILVEDDSQEVFVRQIADRLEKDLDAHSVSLLPVGGQDGYKPYFTMLKSLGIPYVALKDLCWNNTDQYPKEKFFDLGMEIEEYLIQAGNAEIFEKARENVGTGKVRICEEVARLIPKSEIPEVFETLIDAAISNTSMT